MGKEANDNSSQGLMNLVKKVHGLIENTDIEKHRHSQDQVGALLGNSKDVEIEELTIGNMEAEILRVQRLHDSRHIILYCHGGGYSTGSCMYARTLTTKLASITSMDVLSFDYRLAPEHPYPAALEDVMEAWNYLMLMGYGAKDVFVAGDSAGGNLALALGLQLQKEGRRLPGGFFLMSPWTDLTSQGESHTTRAEVDPVLDKEYLEEMIHNYVPEGEALDNPMISPLFGEFKDFPPTYIQVGNCEVLLSDSQHLQKKMKKAGVHVVMDVYPKMWHVFQMAPLKVANEAMQKGGKFIYDILNK